jgi:uncharacterized damage-inducible protein DinB
MHQLLLSQYEDIQGSRQALFDYCETIDSNHLFKKIEIFNDSCIVDLLVHNANTYIHWLNNFGLDGAIPFHESADIKTLKAIETLYEQVNQVVYDFLQKYSLDYGQLLTKKTPRRQIVITVTPLQLFTHVITHEFHHKGQIMTMSRLLGYTPVDTDVIRY